MLPQHDPNLKEHGCVRVTYKEAVHDPDGDVPWLPVKYNEKGEKVTDPNGVFFMSHGLVIDLSKPPPIETWKHGDFSDAEGLQKKDVWKKGRVMNDILQHRMLAFPPEQQDQWRAINEFHTRYVRSDEVPNLPLTLRAG